MTFYIYPRLNQIKRSAGDSMVLELNHSFKYMIGIADIDYFLLNPLPTFNPRVIKCSKEIVKLGVQD